MMVSIKVKKRDGSLEEFDQVKLVKVLNTAGLDEKSSIKVSENIAHWLATFNTEYITSIEIKDRVIQELKKVNIYTANLYTWYEKTKE